MTLILTVVHGSLFSGQVFAAGMYWCVFPASLLLPSVVGVAQAESLFAFT